jgi:transposase, IS605 orfB family
MNKTDERVLEEKMTSTYTLTNELDKFNLSQLIKSFKVRKVRGFISEKQKDNVKTQLKHQTSLYNFTLKYLYDHFGRFNIKRHLADNMTNIQYMVRDIRRSYMLYLTNGAKNRWDIKKTGIHSQAAQEFIGQIIRNFIMYRKTYLIPRSKWSDEAKAQYKVKNGKAWYRAGALKFKDQNETTDVLTLPNNSTIKFPDRNCLYIQSIGHVMVNYDLSNLEPSDIAQVKFRIRGNGDAEVQLVISYEVERKEAETATGYDWGMHENTVWTSNTGEKINLENALLEELKVLERQIQDLDTQMKNHRKGTSKYKKLEKKRQKLYAKHTHKRENQFRHDAIKMLEGTDVIALENLDSFTMRRQGKTSAKNKGFNSKLSVLSPYKQIQFIKQLANRLGKTVLLVDPKYTSQFDYGTSNYRKHELNERSWYNALGELIDRDINAAMNILKWALNPELHGRLIADEEFKKDYEHWSQLVKVY